MNTTSPEKPAAAVISIGAEILLGATLDTNANYLARELSALGWDVRLMITTGDRLDDIFAALEYVSQRASVFILTGGLGPTFDDLTRDALSFFSGQPLKSDAPSLARLEEFFRMLNRPMSENNRRQALLPEGATVILNPLGTAPGIRLEKNSRVYYALPGVPYEMKAMFAESVLPELRRQSAPVPYKKIKIFGLAESKVDEILRGYDLREFKAGITVSLGEITVRLESRDGFALDALVEKLKSDLGVRVFSTGEEHLQDVVARLLAEHKMKFAIAESITGGLIAHLMTQIAGISDRFMESVVAYDNGVKIRRLGVSEESLKKFGAVSEQVAGEMARGARERGQVDVAVSVTGIAGPGGGTPEKPVGLVYFAVAHAGNTIVEKRVIPGERIFIKEIAARSALDLLRRCLLELPSK